MLRLTRHAQAEPHTSTPRRHDLGVLRTDEFFFDIARYRNETHVHLRTPSVKSTVGKALHTRASAASEWSPAEAERTVKSARPAVGGCNVSYAARGPMDRTLGRHRPRTSSRALGRQVARGVGGAFSARTDQARAVRRGLAPGWQGLARVGIRKPHRVT